MSTLAGRRGMRPKMMMPFDAQPPQRKCVCVSDGWDRSSLTPPTPSTPSHDCPQALPLFPLCDAPAAALTVPPVRPSSSPSAAVISAHPIHSLDNHHHHYHMGSLASPPRSYFYHQGSGHPRPHACATPITHLDRVESTGERPPPAGRRRLSAHPPSSLHSCPAAILLHLYVFKPFLLPLLPRL